jgi:uncharacterized protein (DUF885 family)
MPFLAIIPERTLMRIAKVAVFVCLLAAWCLGVAAVDDVNARRKQLDNLLAEQWEYNLRTNPEFASIIGDKRYNDRLSDTSYEFIQKDLAETRKFLARFEAIDTTGFPDQEALNKTLMVRSLQEQLDGARFKEWEMPVSQNSGIHLDLPQMVSLLAFTNVKDYEDYTARLKQVPRVFNETTDLMRRGLAEHRMPPKFLLEKVVKQSEGIANDKPEDSPFAQPLKKFPDAISAADRTRLQEQMLSVIRTDVLPTYAKFAKFVAEVYAPKGRTEVGVWALPDGSAYYAFRVKQSTTTDMTPEQIHRLGLQQVAADRAEMLSIAQKMGYPDLKSFEATIKTNPALRPKSRQEMLDLYTRYIDTMWAKLPQLFGRLPKAKLEVLPVESFREKEASGAQYNTGTPDGSRPGHVMVNTGDYQDRSIIDIETTAYHEGVPGHHLQLSIAQEAPTLPPFRQHAYYTAYIEGWALYSERLGKEVGFFTDPYNDYGRLQDDLLRAIRLVVDTGIHYKHWTRQQVVDYFHENSAIDEPTVQSETDRYIAWPAQALGYKIGQLKLIELRERSKKALGDKFDLRAFHDEVIDAGALPLDVVDSRVNQWTRQQLAGGGTKQETTVSK